MYYRVAAVRDLHALDQLLDCRLSKAAEGRTKPNDLTYRNTAHFDLPVVAQQLLKGPGRGVRVEASS